MNIINSTPYSENESIFIIQFPKDQYDLDGIKEIINLFSKTFNNKIVCIPDDIQISILKKENLFL